MHTSLRQVRTARTARADSGRFGQQRAATHHFGPLFGGSPTYLRGLPTRLRSVRAERAAAGCYGPLRTTSRRFPHLLARFADATSERSGRTGSSGLLWTTFRGSPTYLSAYLPTCRSVSRMHATSAQRRLKLHGHKAVPALLGRVRRLGLGWLGCWGGWGGGGGWGDWGGSGWVGVVGGCEHTALSASAFGIHSATYNSCNSVAGKRQAIR